MDSTPTTNKDDASSIFWRELQEKYPALNVVDEYHAAASKLGRHPTRSYFDKWLEYAANDILPTPPGVPTSRWTPPAKQTVLDFARSKGWPAGFALHTWSTFIANNWHHYGQPITSDDQWQAIMSVTEWNP
jgi:hypothetical protein